jgi:hypothetical protein
MEPQLGGKNKTKEADLNPEQHHHTSNMSSPHHASRATTSHHESREHCRRSISHSARTCSLHCVRVHTAVHFQGLCPTTVRRQHNQNSTKRSKILQASIQETSLQQHLIAYMRYEWQLLNPAANKHRIRTQLHLARWKSHLAMLHDSCPVADTAHEASNTKLLPNAARLLLSLAAARSASTNIQPLASKYGP